jgi:anti-sigma regulatory factor (Ser/Thr protein kinase)
LRRDERYDVALALGEALGNAYDHAAGVGCILTVQAYGDRVVLEVLDRGAGYSIDGASEPVASEERGRGIKLMRMLVDNVEVARRTDGAGTRVRMVKLFGSALESCA